MYILRNSNFFGTSPIHNLKDSVQVGVEMFSFIFLYVRKICLISRSNWLWVLLHLKTQAFFHHEFYRFFERKDDVFDCGDELLSSTQKRHPDAVSQMCT